MTIKPLLNSNTAADIPATMIVDTHVHVVSPRKITDASSEYGHLFEYPHLSSFSYRLVAEASGIRLFTTTEPRLPLFSPY
jgi:hypothetical protein